MSMDPDKDMLALPAEAKLGGSKHDAERNGWLEMSGLGERLMRGVAVGVPATTQSLALSRFSVLDCDGMRSPNWRVVKVRKGIAMKASLLFVASLTVTFLSIASANADWRNTSASSPESCNVGGWPTLSPTCKNMKKFKTYAECVQSGLKYGNRSADMWWYCSSLGFKD
jgi:hypothetical protein